MTQKYRYEDYWPRTEIELNTITGATEAGVDLFLIGSFGGHGGNFVYVHEDLAMARNHANKLNEGMPSHHMSVFRLSVKKEIE